MSDHRKGQLGLLLVAVIWGSGFVMSAVSLESFTPYQVLALRFTLAFVAMILLFYHQLEHMTKRTFIKGVLLGVILYLAFLFQTIGLVYTTPSKNAFLTAFNVVLVPMLGAIFFKKKMSFQNFLGAAFAIVGIAVISLTNFHHINRGDLFTLVCALFFAMQIIYTSLYVKGENAYALNLIQMGTAAVCGIVVAIIEGQKLELSQMDGNLSVLYLGLVSTMLAFLLQTASQQFTKETETAIILSTEAVFGMLFSALLLKEPISFQMLLGASLILTGIWIVEMNIKSMPSP